MNVDCDQVTLPVYTATRLGLLVTEFLTNALEHAFVGRDIGMIRVRLENVANGVVRLSVEDDGMGLPEGKAWPDPSISLSDMTAKTGERSRPSGRGLGGAVVKALVKAIGGKLAVIWTPHGTLIMLDLPTAK
jgi:two-component sensor histidine kinase